MCPYMSLKTAAAALLILFGADDVAGQSSPTSDVAEFCVAGVVRNEQTGVPHPGVAVSIDSVGRGAIADSAGTYRICGLEAGEYTVSARRVGFYIERRDIRLDCWMLPTVVVGDRIVGDCRGGEDSLDFYMRVYGLKVHEMDAPPARRR